ncbi:FAD-binding oxidoreductase [Mesorhizobium sp. M8A.F.Ca.ET.208.01.1.1]|uniref:D-2-hydroxyglutarate dehydrogenase YdiJ n=1 Tax=unclassified Mesorhizobium TaxID=325217 RepID=UPI001093B86E|nr:MULTISPECIES: FAD-binding and (Fe-S)-binding domain-containing protein [unclassified Mesorhizobium]TGQ94543.1 FAD-binding oxidoreductase [Mesorhizobium sp. M8A.F.Ca.ET.208.01.1.1]TGT55031.1 FAD-binding oxidoreductase [Mesorhizobium sp. M8A.F.Ca.ET.167.01.1.1]
MIPRLDRLASAADAPASFFERLIEAGFRGDIEKRAASRTVYATDNSIYQMEPKAIVFPRDAEDLQIIARTLSEPAFRTIVIAPRGGGTGTNGQSLTDGVVVDCSRHMNRILEIDPVRRTARVEAGVVKDQLNRALKPHGLFFAPELSTSNRATIGGMISTDACGQGSCLYGKTSNHVLGLRLVLMDASDFWSRPLENAELTEICARDDRIGEVHRIVDRITREKQERVAEVFPNLNRYMTGYDLAHVRRQDGLFDLNAVLCGSEGTLALIAEAELNLMPLPAEVALINIQYGDFNAALEDARNLVALGVASVETVDEKVLGLAKGDIVWSAIGRFFPTEGGRAANGINIVEILADDGDALEQKIAEVAASLEARPGANRLRFTVARGHADAESIWSMRKRAVGLLGNVEGSIRPVPFVEDTAVPPEHLAAYIREFRDLLDRAGVSYGMFGHVDAGVLHVRPALDLVRPDHTALVRQISDAVVALTRKYGGVLWGEHGKGVRSEYVPEFFGDLYPCLQDIKRGFDPQNRLNPGKITSIDGRPLLKIDEVPLRGDFDRIIGHEIRAAFDNAAYCNGNGACFDFDERSPMCPSYKATRDRRQSPKGRASLMREWLRLLAEKGTDPGREVERLRKAVGLWQLPRRILNSFNPTNAGDFSHEVKAAMDSCLACKACAGQCPVKVSVPSFRAKFLEIYHGRYLRPLKDSLVASIETMLPMMARVRPLYNLVAGTMPGKALTRMAGLTALPPLPAVSLRREARRLGVAIAHAEDLTRFANEKLARTVVFVPDVFTSYFDPDVALAAISLARKLGYEPLLAAPHINGKALHVHGYLARFEKAARETSAYLQGLADLGVTLVGIDPSMTLAFRSEYSALPGKPLGADVALPQEWLANVLAELPRAKAIEGTRYTLMPHCTERTNAPAAIGQWKAVFAQFGIELEVAETGCCGMAGTFGHETRNRRLSEALYEMSWKSPIAGRQKEDVVMVTGYSCRSQVKILGAVAVEHPLQIIARLVNSNA